MREERLSVSPRELDWYVTEAKRLRSQEISRIAGGIFQLPARLIQRFSSKADHPVNLDAGSANQST